jgi:hypothetical protein
MRRRWIIGLIAFAVLLAVGFWVVFGNPFASGEILISRETTRITEPLDDEGHVDYVAALNQRYGAGVTPENNAAVLIVEALGPSPNGDPLPASLFEQLGIPRPEVNQEAYKPIDEFIDQLVDGAAEEGPTIEETPPADASEDQSSEADEPTYPSEEFYDQFRTAQVRPWSAEDYPWLAEEVLPRNEAALDRFVEASRRTRWFVPLERDVSLIEQVVILQSAIRDPTRLLCARAMHRLQAGDIDGACDDVIAARRLGRLVCQGATLIDALVGITVGGWGIQAQAAMAHSGELSTDQRERLAHALDDLPPPHSLAELVDEGERFMALESIQLTARGKMAVDVSRSHKAALTTGVDWNRVLAQINNDYDQLASALEPASAAARLQDTDKYYDLLSQRRRNRSILSYTGSMISQHGRSKLVGQLISEIMLPSAISANNAWDRATVYDDLAALSLALGAYRAEHDEYPPSLDVLVPDYCDALPQDLYAEGPYKYRRTDEGCVLYSVGPNGQDNQGRAEWMPGEIDIELLKDADDVYLYLPPLID